MVFSRPRYLSDNQSAEIHNKMKSGTFTPSDINKLVFGRSIKSNYVKHILYSPDFDIKKIKKPSKSVVAITAPKKRPRGRPRKTVK